MIGRLRRSNDGLDEGDFKRELGVRSLVQRSVDRAKCPDQSGQLGQRELARLPVRRLIGIVGPATGT
jgi:hypothetical protein